MKNVEPWKGKAFTKEGADFPATFIVSWDDAIDFLPQIYRTGTPGSTLVERTGKYTLPTSAQWERACRAGAETRFSFGDDELKTSLTLRVV